MGSKSRLNATERREAVLSLLRRQEPAKVLARRHGISENTLYRWRDEFVTGGEAALAGGNAVETIIGADPSKSAFSGVRVAESYDSSSSSAPLLHIEIAGP